MAQKCCWRQQKVGCPDPGRMRRMVKDGGRGREVPQERQAPQPQRPQVAFSVAKAVPEATSPRCGGLGNNNRDPVCERRLSGVRSHQWRQNCHHSSSNLLIHLRSREENFLRTPRALKRTPTLETADLGGGGVSAKGALLYLFVESIFAFLLPNS